MISFQTSEHFACLHIIRCPRNSYRNFRSSMKLASTELFDVVSNLFSFSFFSLPQVYLLKNNKKVSKKRTSTKRGERNPIFNEALSYSVPPFLLNSIQVRLTVMNVLSPAEGTDGIRRSQPIGHVIVGSCTDGKGLLHWHQMITSLRKPVAMFHPLRRSAIKNQ